MNKRQILNGYRQMRQDIEKNKDRHLVHIHSLIKKYFKDTQKEKWSFKHFITTTEIEDEIFESLEQTYSITVKAIEVLYGIKPNLKDRIEVADLMYSADGKTLYERLQIHFETACRKDNPFEYLFNRCVLIMDTETSCVSNGLIHGKVSKHASHVEVIGGADCDNHPECEFWISKGKMPVEDLEELPPYHPECGCDVIYYIEEE